VLDNLHWKLAEGERVALIGPNGAGKTTLFLLLCGILAPDQGEIRFKGEKLEPHTFNARIAYLFQSADDQLFSATLFDDVAFGPLNMNLEKEEVKKRVADALARVGCAALASRPPHHLSGGEKRMAALATILAMSPEVILFDEPTSNLDSRNRRQVISTIRSLEKTLLIASHDLEFLLETCTRVILLDGGKIIKEGPIKEILADEILMKAHGLEKPHSLVNHAFCNHSHQDA
jgi:cobalt/nickel transport system ATP-binding protein